MKPKTLLRKLALAAMLLMPAAVLVSCEEDAPELAHQASELSHEWMWNTDEGDCGEGFSVWVTNISDTEIEIGNFHGWGESLKMTIDGTNLKADDSVDFNGGQAKVKNAKGFITNSWTEIVLEYDVYSEETEHFKIRLTEDKVASKKALAL